MTDRTRLPADQDPFIINHNAKCDLIRAAKAMRDNHGTRGEASVIVNADDFNDMLEALKKL